MPRLTLVFVLGICLLSHGCGGSADAPPAPEVPTAGPAIDDASEKAMESATVSESTSASDSPAGAAEVTLEIKSWDEAQELVKQAQGKIVVVDLWATYCGPCLKELPHLVELHQKHSDQVACITISLDYQGFEDEPVESYRDSVLEVLKGKNATMTNVLCSTESDVIYAEKISQGSIPVVFVYGRDGKLAGTFPNPEDPAEFTYQADVLPLVNKLLAE